MDGQTKLSRAGGPYSIEYHRTYGTLVERRVGLSRASAAKHLARYLKDSGGRAFVAVFHNGREVAPHLLRDE